MLTQPSSFSFGSSSSKRIWFIVGAIVVIALVVVLAVFQQGGYLQTRVLTPESAEEVTTDTSNTDSEQVLLDDYTLLETYCQQVKEAHITECGSGYPENDFNCRTQEAATAFQECMDNTPAEIEPLLNEDYE